jgi:hypothetical protein
MNAKLKLPSIQGMTGREESLFSPGGLLQADDLTGIGEYFKKRERLMFRTLFGCGVMCGLVVRPHEDECKKLHIGIDCGVALDCCGDPVEVPKAEELVIDLCDVKTDGPLWIVMRRIEKCCAPRTAVCAEDDEEAPSVCTRLREGYEITVLDTKPKCACICEPLEPPKEPAANVKIETGAGAHKVYVNEHKPLPIRGVATPCLCVDPKIDCYRKHYLGECCCDSSDCCDCEWIVLAQVQKNTNPDPKEPAWLADHRYRRFVRPVLMRDPQVWKEQAKNIVV